MVFGKEEGLSLRNVLCFICLFPSAILVECNIQLLQYFIGVHCFRDSWAEPGRNICLSQITFPWHQQAPAAWEESA